MLRLLWWKQQRLGMLPGLKSCESLLSEIARGMSTDRITRKSLILVQIAVKPPLTFISMLLEEVAWENTCTVEEQSAFCLQQIAYRRNAEKTTRKSLSLA